MKTFGFTMTERNYPYNFYVAGDNVPDDSVLWDWLIADNFKETNERGALSVLAPEGYIFEGNTLVPLSECTEEEIASADGDDSEFYREAWVRTAYRYEDKANLLLEGVMEYLSPAEFYALSIPEDRIRYFTID